MKIYSQLNNLLDTIENNLTEMSINSNTMHGEQ